MLFNFATFLSVASVFIVGLFLIINAFENNHGYPKIDFKSFQKFYALNPDRWNCKPNYVICHTDDRVWAYENFDFGVRDYYKYRFWLIKQVRKKTEDAHNSSKQRMMDAVKIDIAASEAEAKRLQEEWLNTLKQRYKNLQEEDLMDLMELVEGFKKAYGKS